MTGSTSTTTRTELAVGQPELCEQVRALGGRSVPVRSGRSQAAGRPATAQSSATDPAAYAFAAAESLSRIGMPPREA